MTDLDTLANQETPPPLKRGSRSWFTLSTSREERFFLLLAVFIGLFSGLAVVCFRLAIDWTKIWLLGPVLEPHSWRLIAAPAAVGLIVALLVIHVFPLVRGSGVNQTKAALYIYNGYIPFRTALGKFITAALAIGSGQSLGPEDPSLQIGASLASALGRRLELSRERLAPAGSGRSRSGIGGRVQCADLRRAVRDRRSDRPLERRHSWFGRVVGSFERGGGALVSRVGASFRIPAVGLVRPTELLAYAFLGVVGGLAAVIFAKGIGYFRPRLRAWPRWTQYFQPAVAGLVIGLIGYLGAPQVMGAGYEYMDQAMHDQFTWKMLAILALLKIVATTLSFVSGAPGGMFAPTLFIGAMLGGAVGGVERALYPGLTGSTATYALVGMGVLFAAFLRAPMTSVFMVLEVSGNYSIIVPVIVANTLAYVISRGLQPTPIFDLLTRQDGLDLPSLEEQREQIVLRVEDAMKPAPTPVLDAQDSVEQAWRRVQELPRNFPCPHGPEWVEQHYFGHAQASGWRRQRRNDLRLDSAGTEPALPPSRPHSRSGAAACLSGSAGAGGAPG